MTAALASDPVEARRQRGLAIASVTRITRAKGQEERWIVPSQTGRRNYTVDMTGESPTCDCADFGERGGRCKHVFAVEFFKAPETAPEPLTRPATPSERISIPLRTCNLVCLIQSAYELGVVAKFWEPGSIEAEATSADKEACRDIEAFAWV